MAWDQLSINKPHLVYIILGGFTSIFMLMSLFIKEKLYIGEATVATICGLVFGPHGANLIDPRTWGNTDQITLEFSRIVLVVQCFAVGVELPKSYMNRHWSSVVLLLLPVMTFGWLITSLFIWWMIVPLTWLESLCVAACVTATDPVLASSVVGRGKFAKRVPKHIRDLLSCESGCNDGMAFPFIYLALDLIHYHLDAKHTVQHWFCNTILYECIWGAVYGVLVGYIARHAIKLAEKRGIIDRESFLVFYFVLALFCAGSGALLGMDDLLVGFAAGVGFSNDGWFTEKTEESHVSNVIDLLLNLTYFVYLGTIIPWEQFNSGLHGLDAWRLVVIAILVLFFRRIPIMLMLKPIIPDIKTWREALFCGHFGPIGVGAIFVAILARAELETETTTPLAVLDPDGAEYVLTYTIWPIVTFLVITSIVVHGSSIAVFTLGKRINTLTMTLSYTQGNENSSNWMERLPRIASRSKSQGKSFTSDYSEDEKLDVPPGQLPPTGIPKLHLRRQKEDDDKGYLSPRGGNRSKARKRKSGLGAGGPISDSAIMPQRASDPGLLQQVSGSDTPNVTSAKQSPELTSDQLERLRSDESDSDDDLRRRESQKEEGKRDSARRPQDNDHVEVEAYEERNHLIVEDEEGNVLESVNTDGQSEEQKAAIVERTRRRLKEDSSGRYTKHKHMPHEANTAGGEVENEAKDSVEHPEKHFRSHFKGWKGFGKGAQSEQPGPHKKPAERKRGPAHAYQIGSTIIVEDEDGEVIHKYDIPRGDQEPNKYNNYMRQRVRRMGTWAGLGRSQSQAAVPMSDPNQKSEDVEDMSTSSPEKEGQEGEAEKHAPLETRPKKPQRSATQAAADDGLRMVISNAEQYGLTGLRKQRPGERPGILETSRGRRMSTNDFVRHMQDLDRNSRQVAMNQAGVDSNVQEAINRGAVTRDSLEPSSGRPKTRNRAGTMPSSKYKSPIVEKDVEDEEAADYFSAKQLSPRSAADQKRAQSDTTGGDRLRAQRAQIEEPVATNDEGEEEDIPTYNVRGTIARHGKGNMTAADARRQRHLSSAQAEEPIDEGHEEQDLNEETAAEKRRRLAALGLGGGESESESDDEAPRVPRKAVQEPGAEAEEAQAPPREREQPAQPPRMRIQWGGETREKGWEADDVEAQAEGSGGHGHGVGRKLRGFLNR